VMRNRNLSGDVRLPLRLDIRRYDVRFEQTFALQLASAKSENGRQLVRATSSRARKSAASEPHLIASVPSITT
jgi:hypothetical protein